MRLNIKTGQRFGKLKVIRESERLRLPSGQTNRAFECKCDCGNVKVVRLLHLVRARITSCGCIKGESHNMSGSKLYRVWRAMNERCYYSPNKSSKNYKGRGITVCDDWQNSFISFKDWAINNGYKEGLQIDRKDNDGNYEPENCRWVSSLVNVNNRTVTIYGVYKGVKKSLMELVREKGLYNVNWTIRARVLRGWTFDEAFDTPIKQGKYFRGKRAFH